MASEFTVAARGATLSGEEAGEGPSVVLLHGLTATRRYVVMGSRSLERGGHRVITYDARGHGESEGGSEPFTYDLLAEDLVAVMDQRGVERAVLAGVSMGAHTILNLALAAPERVAGLVVITPAFDPSAGRDGHRDRLAAALRSGGVDAFVDAYDLSDIDATVRDTVKLVLRQRMERHSDLDAVARALEEIPGSRPFERLAELEAIAVPTAVIGSNDGADPEHPQRVAEAYADAIARARLVLDEPGRSPVAWQGSQVSRVIAEIVQAAGD